MSRPAQYPPGDAHRKASREYQTRKREARRENNLCLRCGEPAEPKLGGGFYHLCHKHACERATKRNKKRREQGIKPRYPSNG